MLNFRRNFYTFNANQPGSAQAMAELDGCCNGSSPYVIGDTIAVFMHTYSSSKWQEQHYKDADNFVKDIMKKYKLKYRKVCFKD